MTYSAREQLDAFIRRSLFAFTWFVFDLLHPGDRFVPAWHVKAMVRALEDAMAGRTKRLLITIPPRHLKSITASVSLPAFWLGQDPTARIMVASYGADLAAKHARDFRAVLSSPEYQRLFPATRFDPKRNTEFEVMTTARGMRKAVSVGGPVTGFGARVLIVDDLMKAADAQSETERGRVKEFFDQTLYSRMDQKAEGIIIAIQQRLHEDDFAGHLIDKGFEHLTLPAIAEEDETHHLPMGLTHTRRKGEALFPERESFETLEEIRREIGPYAFGAQYQQNPVPPDGATIRWEWFGIYDEQPPRNELLLVVQSWDTAHSTEPCADFSVCTTWGLSKAGPWYLLDLCRRQVDYPTLLRTARDLKRQWEADHIVIEKAGVGYALLADLWKEYRSGIRAYLPKLDKQSRFAAQSAKIESGLIHLPKEAAWLGPFRHEMMAFQMAATMTRSTAWPSSSTGRRSVLPLTAPKPPYKACTLCGEIPSGDDGQSAPLRWATGRTFFGPAREMRTESNKATPGPVSTLKLYTRLSFSPAIGRTLSGTDGFSPRLRP